MAKHRRIDSTTARNPIRLAVGTLPAAVAVLCAGMASAASQPGVTGPVAPQPAVAPGPAAPPNSLTVVPHQTPSQPVSQSHHAAPAPGRSHASAPASPATINVGPLSAPAPAWVPPDVRNQINKSAANTEAQVNSLAQAQVNSLAQSAGIKPSR